jgi:hypothetical protein
LCAANYGSAGLRKEYHAIIVGAIVDRLGEKHLARGSVFMIVGFLLMLGVIMLMRRSAVRFMFMAMG